MNNIKQNGKNKVANPRILDQKAYLFELLRREKINKGVFTELVVK